MTPALLCGCAGATTLFFSSCLCRAAPDAPTLRCAWHQKKRGPCGLRQRTGPARVVRLRGALHRRDGVLACVCRWVSNADSEFSKLSIYIFFFFSRFDGGLTVPPLWRRRAHACTLADGVCACSGACLRACERLYRRGVCVYAAATIVVKRSATSRRSVAPGVCVWAGAVVPPCVAAMRTGGLLDPVSLPLLTPTLSLLSYCGCDEPAWCPALPPHALPPSPLFASPSPPSRASAACCWLPTPCSSA